MRVLTIMLGVVVLLMAAGPAWAGYDQIIDFEDGTFGPFVYRDPGWVVTDGVARCDISKTGTYSWAATVVGFLPASFRIGYQVRADAGTNHILNFLLQPNGDHYHLNYRTAPFNDILLHLVRGEDSIPLAHLGTADADNGQWFTFEVQSADGRLTVTIDDVKVMEILEWKSEFTTGALSMACFVGGSVLEASAAFEYIAILDLDLGSLTLSPGHERVSVDWTHPVAADVVATELYRARVHTPDGASAYPLYERDPEAITPANPASRQEAVDSPQWELMSTTPPEVTHFEDLVAERGRYHYVVFAELADGEYSAAMTHTHAAVNYLVGDVDGNDGVVDWQDLGQMFFRFGADDGDEYFDPALDIAPTSSGGVSGVPQPDGRIDFEDLMLATADFGAVDVHDPPVDVTVPLVADVRLTQIAPTVAICSVIEPGPGFMGLHLTGPTSLGAVTFIDGPLIDELDGVSAFLGDDEFPFDHAYALVGHRALVDQPGTLFTLEFAAPIEIGDVVVEVRGPNNLPVVNDGITTSVEIPAAQAAGVRIYPNPFNPQTRIEYDLPVASLVAVQIFDARGRLVRELARGTEPAGARQWQWDGTDGRGSAVASGVYFCRITTPGQAAVGKLLLAR